MTKHKHMLTYINAPPLSVQEAGIPVTGSVVDKIFEFMDTNGDGTIDLG